MLEQHGIAEMRRGLDGGLVVTEPSPDSVIRTASTYLSHVGLTIGAIREVRLLLEPVGAAFTAERASDEALAELAADHVRVLTLDSRAAPEAARALHERIADLSGNRALALFTRVMIAAAWGLERRPRLPADAVETLRKSDTRIMGALRARDADRTRRMVENHLEVTLEWWSVLHDR